MTTVETVSLTGGDVQVLEMEHRGGFRRKIPIPMKVVDVTHYEGLGNTLAGTYDGLYHLRLTFGEAHGLSVGDFFTTSVSTSNLTTVWAPLGMGPFAGSGTTRIPYAKVVAVESSTTVVATTQYNHTSTYAPVETYAAYGGTGVRAALFGFKHLRLGLRFRLAPRSLSITPTLGASQFYGDGRWNSEIFALGVSSDPLYGIMDGEFDVPFYGMDFFGEPALYTAQSTKSTPIWRDVTAANCDGWGTLSSSYIGILRPTSLTCGGCYSYTPTNADQSFQVQQGSIRGTAPSFDANWYSTYGGNNWIPADNASDKCMCVFIDFVLGLGAGTSSMTLPNYIGHSSYHTGYHCVGAWQSGHQMPTDTGAETPTGITASRFREIMAVQDLFSLSATEVMPTWLIGDNYYNYDLIQDTDDPRPFAVSPYRSHSYQWGVTRPLSYIELFYRSRLNKLRVYDYGWSVLA